MARPRNRPAPEAPRLSLSIQHACDAAGLPARSAIRSWVRSALRAGRPRTAEIVVRFVGDEEARALNLDYRGKRNATNVLAFAYAAAPRLAGDIVLCREVLDRECAEQGKTLAAHCAHLVVHGMLHLQGYDHESDAGTAAMEARETALLRALRYPDPYSPA